MRKFNTQHRSNIRKAAEWASLQPHPTHTGTEAKPKFNFEMLYHRWLEYLHPFLYRKLPKVLDSVFMTSLLHRRVE